MENLEFDLEVAYQEVKDRAMSQGAFSRDEWNDLVEEILDEKREFNELHDDNDWIEIQEALQSRFEDFEMEVPEM